MSKTAVYLREGDEYVGPFHSREDAERFLLLVELSGTSREGIDIVEVDPASSMIESAMTVEERSQLIRDRQSKTFMAAGGFSPLLKI